MDNIPTIYDFLGYLEFLRGFPAAYVVLVTASLILILRDWRWSLIALLVQYLTAGLLFADVMAPHLGFMKVIIGIFVCLVLYVTARQANWGHLPEDVTEEEAVMLGGLRLLRFGPFMLPTNVPFRVFLVLAVTLSVWTITQKPYFHIPGVSDPVNLGILVLIGMGLVTLSLTSEPFKAGLGVLTFIIGFELFFSSVNQSTSSLVTLAVCNLIITLVISSLTQARHSFPALFN